MSLETKPLSPEAIAAREQQRDFGAELLGAPVSQVEAWERSEASPSASEALLLQLAQEHPEVFRAITKLDIAR